MSRIRQHIAKLLPVLILSTFTVAGQAQVKIVNMIPNSRSGETQQDSEPNLAVNPANPQQVAGSAFTPDPLSGPNAPIYVSVNAGDIWVLNSILPGNSALTGTGDVTLRFGGTSNNLYVGDLRGGAGLRLNILRTANFTAPGLMTVLVDRNNVDQPYVQATTVPGGGPDRVYVGNNDFGAVGGRTATVDVSLDGLLAAPPPPSNFVARRIETRATSGQDGPPIRPAFHSDGTIYAVFYGWRAFTGVMATTDLVVVRDDNWAAGATQFAALIDPGDALAGRRVMTNLQVPWNNSSQASFGQERFVGSNISIAVDPRTSSRVYVAWADYPGGVPPYTLHVRRSEDRGATWSVADLITIASATNPALAVNVDGQVGFLYQQVTGAAPQRWETHLRRSSDLGVTWNDLLLARPPANTPAATFIPYLGDYVHLLTLDRTFYGIFSANNTPDLANFPQGVTYQRNANFTTHTLLNTNNVTPVASSIDPFFFRVCNAFVPQIVSFTQTGPSNVSFLKCPAGQKVLSGGCSDDFTSTSLMSSLPWGDDGWACDFKTQPGSLTSWALCETVADTACRGVTTVRNTVSTGTTVSVACPSTSLVIGGGCSDDFTSTDLRTSMPSGNGWSCQFATNPGSLTAYAMCANPAPGATIQTVSLNQTASNVAFIKCPAGKRVLGGGCQDVLGSTLLESTYPWANDGWICNFQNVTGNLTVYAICE
ncbi:MAG TPA: sialidase family protein [Thermoanaerobaculia bacterium]|nr:sialidase family protein [Thermoanaerobaculia bacterium]